MLLKIRLVEKFDSYRVHQIFLPKRSFIPSHAFSMRLRLQAHFYCFRNAGTELVDGACRWEVVALGLEIDCAEGLLVLGEVLAEHIP